jgi:hypothetical protein
VQELTQCLITTSGHITPIKGKITSNSICKLIKADQLDFVTLGKQGGQLWLMAVDDLGWDVAGNEVTAQEHDGWTHITVRATRPLKPVNQIATTLYRSVRGGTHQIVGDVVILPDSD